LLYSYAKEVKINIMQPDNNPIQPNIVPPQGVPVDPNNMPPATQQGYQPTQPVVAPPVLQPMPPQPSQAVYPQNVQPSPYPQAQPVGVYAGQMPNNAQQSTNTGGGKIVAKKIYILIISLFLFFAGGDGLYANAKHHSWNLFVTPFNLLLIGLGCGLLYTYIIKNRFATSAPKSGSKRAIIIAGNVILVFVALLMLIGALTSNSSDKNGTKAGNTSASSSLSSMPYSDPTYGTKITPPSGWVQYSQSGDLVDFKAASPDSSGFAPLITVQHQAWQSASLDQYVSQGEAGEAKSFQNYKKLGADQAETVGGLPAVLITFSGTLQGHDLTNEQLILVDQSKNQVFLVNGVSDSTNWSQNQNTMQKALLSFQP
jgi:hypothetical protein